MEMSGTLSNWNKIKEHAQFLKASVFLFKVISLWVWTYGSQIMIGDVFVKSGTL